MLVAAAITYKAAAQNQLPQHAVARQPVSLRMGNVMAISMLGNNQTVIIPFTKLSDFTNGAVSATQELKIQSNQPFNIEVSTRSANDYMPVDGILGLIISKNGTGGSIATPFNNKNYARLSETPQSLISTGTNGGNQTFSVIYYANPNLNYQPDEYMLNENVIYTTTQL
jgi:hypothetical protein